MSVLIFPRCLVSYHPGQAAGPVCRLTRFVLLAMCLWCFLFMATVVNTKIYLKYSGSKMVSSSQLHSNSLSGEGGDYMETAVRDMTTTTFKPRGRDRSRNPFQAEKKLSVDCKPQRKVAFAKTHKTGSSTVQNILLRYGVREDLLFAMPQNSWIFDLKKPINTSAVLEGPWKDLGQFDIFAFHSRWETEKVLEMVPGAKIVTILREPLSAFESNYIYMGVQNARKADINEFAKKFAAKDEKRQPLSYVGKNNLLWDLGLDANEVESQEEIDAKIKEVDDRFELVMMMERFEESMVLLADVLCWPLEDVMYLKQNERMTQFKSTPTDETKKIMRTWLAGDYKLYDHFQSKFDARIEQYGRERMKESVEKLKRLNSRLKSECLKDKEEVANVKVARQVYTLIAQGDKPWCLPYLRRETDFCKMIREHQTSKVQEFKLKGLIDTDS